MRKKINFVLFGFMAHQYISCGTKTGKMILAYLECYKLKATPGVKIASPLGARKLHFSKKIQKNHF
jgi:hypothetical protein